MKTGAEKQNVSPRIPTVVKVNGAYYIKCENGGLAAIPGGDKVGSKPKTTKKGNKK